MSILLTLTSCEDVMVGKMPDNSNETNFRMMWGKVDSHYGLFLVKNIDWNAVYTSQLPLAKAAKTDKELFSVLSSALRVLDDKHVNIYANDPNLADFNSGENGHIPAQEDYQFKTVKDNYLIDYQQDTEELGFGKLSSEVGYIHVSGFMEKVAVYEKSMDKALAALAATKGIIVDIRDHKGGNDNVSKYIAGRFASKRKLYMTSKKRSGPGHDQFDTMISWYVEPSGKNQYTKPVVLLTTSATLSAGETFTFAMRENDNVTHMGTTTAGAFSDQIAHQLPNGWIFTIGVGDYRGSDGKSYEGIGIMPQVLSTNKKSDVLNGIDKTLELADELLKKGFF